MGEVGEEKRRGEGVGMTCKSRSRGGKWVEYETQ